MHGGSTRHLGPFGTGTFALDGSSSAPKPPAPSTQCAAGRGSQIIDRPLIGIIRKGEMLNAEN